MAKKKQEEDCAVIAITKTFENGPILYGSPINKPNNSDTIIVPSISRPSKKIQKRKSEQQTVEKER
ncbi:MAG: hypothetical protein IJ673_13630 [Treponema sp.]|nr:hypothetical protein [Treponema sp.]